MWRRGRSSGGSVEGEQDRFDMIWGVFSESDLYECSGDISDLVV